MIHNDLLNHKQSCLAICNRAEQFSVESINSISAEKRNLLESKVREIRSSYTQVITFFIGTLAPTFSTKTFISFSSPRRRIRGYVC